MSEYLITRDDSEPLTHYGVRGMKWKHHKKKPMSKEEMYNDSFKPFDEGHPREDYSLKTARKNLKKAGWSKKSIDKNIKRDIRLREKGWKQGFRDFRTRKEGTLSSRTDYKKVLKSKANSVLKSSKKAVDKGKSKMRKVEKNARWGVYNTVRKTTKSSYSPQDIVKLPKKKREKEYAKNKRSHNIALKVSGIGKYGVKRV